VNAGVKHGIAAILALLAVGALCLLAWQRKSPAHPPPAPQPLPEIYLKPLLFQLRTAADRPAEMIQLSCSFLPPIHRDSAAVTVDLDGLRIAALSGGALNKPPDIPLPVKSGRHRLSIRGQLYEGRLIEEEIAFLLPHETPPGMIPVLAGAFMMGCPLTDADCSDSRDETPLHRVALDGFFLAARETTRREYEACVEAGGCTAAARSSETGQEPEAPAVGVTWDQARAYCAWRGGRLPTEAEWEFVASTGLEKPLAATAWFDDFSRAVPHPAGGKAPDARGIYDLFGNVWEWCEDVYDPAFYQAASAENPVNRGAGDKRVLRGGSWHDPALLLRPSNRAGRAADRHGPDIGFRCARDFE